MAASRRARRDHGRPQDIRLAAPRRRAFASGAEHGRGAERFTPPGSRRPAPIPRRGRRGRAPCRASRAAPRAAREFAINCVVKRQAAFPARTKAASKFGSASVRTGRSLNAPSRSDGAFGGRRPRRIPTSRMLRNSMRHRAGTNASPRRKRVRTRSEPGAASSSNNSHEAATDASRTKTLDNDGPRGAPRVSPRRTSRRKPTRGGGESAWWPLRARPGSSTRRAPRARGADIERGIHDTALEARSARAGPGPTRHAAKGALAS